MSPYGEGLDPVPYIAASYGVATVLLGGFAAWIFLQRKKLKLLKDAVSYKEKS